MTLQQIKLQYDALGLDYMAEFKKASASVHPAISFDDKQEIIRKILEDGLRQYSNSNAKTKGGKVARFFARLIAAILPFVKLNKNDTKQC